MDQNGVPIKEMQFQTADDAAGALRVLFGDALKSQKQRNHDAINTQIRQQYSAGIHGLEDLLQRRF